MKSFVVIGLGLFGTKLATDLYEAGHFVMTIDKNEEVSEMIADKVSKAVTLDATNRNALSQLGISKYDCTIVGTSGDLASSVLITMNLKALDAKQIICKVHDETDREILTTLGASQCIIPEHIGASNLSHTLTGRNILDFMQLSDLISVVELSIPKSWIGHSISDLNVRSRYGLNIIALRRNDSIHVEFDPKQPLLQDDILVIAGKDDTLQKFISYNR